MRVKGEILKVETTGDQLAVEIQGKQAGAADWRPMSTIRITVADDDTARRALHIGREVILTVELARAPRRRRR
jgi:hypothetical protein